jgi:hypothetical protein
MIGKKLASIKEHTGDTRATLTVTFSDSTHSTPVWDDNVEGDLNDFAALTADPKSRPMCVWQLDPFTWELGLQQGTRRISIASSTN